MMAYKKSIALLLLAVHVYTVNSKNVYFKEKEPFTLDCKASRYATNSTYTWLKNGSIKLNISTYDDIVLKENGSIEFTDPKDYQEGSYQCFADTKWGITSSSIYIVRKAMLEYEKKTFSHKAVEGKPYELKCSSPRGVPKPNVYWAWVNNDNNTNVMRIKDTRAIQGPHITDNTLYIREIIKEDAKTKFLCMAESLAVNEPVVLAEHVFGEVLPSDGSNGTVELQYVSDEAVSFIESLDDSGETALLYCIYGGKKLEQPEWFKGDEKLQLSLLEHFSRALYTNGQVLKIRQPTFDDVGTYACEVDVDGKKVRHNMNLILVSPPIFVNKMKDGYIEKAGKDLTIPCQVAGNSVPKMKWTFEAKPLEENDRVIVNRTTQGYMAISDLTIKNLQKSDQGNYGCRADNDQGFDYIETYVGVEEK